MSVEAKAARLLAEGRVVVVFADESSMRARVVGNTGVYDVVVNGSGASCSCASWRRRCSHATAVELISGERT